MKFATLKVAKTYTAVEPQKVDESGIIAAAKSAAVSEVKPLAEAAQKDAKSAIEAADTAKAAGEAAVGIVTDRVLTNEEKDAAAVKVVDLLDREVGSINSRLKATETLAATTAAGLETTNATLSNFQSDVIADIVELADNANFHTDSLAAFANAGYLIAV